MISTRTSGPRPRPRAPGPATSEHNGKAERYDRPLAEEVLCATEWTSEAQRTTAIGGWNIHYNYHREHTAIGDRPPAALLRATFTNVITRNIERSGTCCQGGKWGVMPYESHPELPDVEDSEIGRAHV